MYDRLRTFLEVYRQQSMGKAANALGLTQPAISNQIAALEQSFGAPLFDRSNAGVTPTAVADSLARDVASLIDELEGAVQARLARHQSLSGLVHLGAPPEMFSVYGGRIAAAFAGTAIRLQIHLGGRDKLIAGLEDGAIDMALLASPPRGRALVSQRVGAETLRLYAHPSLAEKSRGRTIDADWLCDEPFVAYDQDLSLIRQYFERVFSAACVGQPIITAPDLRTIGAICACRPAWCILPDYIAQDIKAANKLIPLLPEKSVVNAFNLVLKRVKLRTARVAFAREAIADAWQGE